MYVIECECGRRTETAETDLICGGCGKSLSIQGWGQWPTPEVGGKSILQLSVDEAHKIIHNAILSPADGQRDHDGVTPARVEGDVELLDVAK